MENLTDRTSHKYGLDCEFDIEKHKDTFINYLEVCLDISGKPHYAVPSHCEMLIQEMCRLYHTDRDGVYKMCPREYSLDVMEWMLQKTGMVAVWSRGYKGTPNLFQQATLEEFIKNDLMEDRVLL